MTTNDKSKNTLIPQQNVKNFNSKISFETPLTTKESSTSSLINRLRIRPDKNRSKKVSRTEMDNMMRIMSEILIKVSNNRMRLDTLEGNVETKIENLIKDFTDLASSEIQTLQDEVRDDIAKLHKRLGEFERLNFRLNKKILDKPYKYADDIKESLEQEDKNIKVIINKKHDLLLSRIVELRNQFNEQVHKEYEDPNNKGFQTFGPENNKAKLSIQLDFENSKLLMLQNDIETLREQLSNESFSISKSISNLQNTIDDYKDKIDFQIYEFKSTTTQQVNNSVKEFESFEHELKRFQDLYREILNKYCKAVEKNAKTEKIKVQTINQTSPKVNPKVMGKEVRSRIHSISPTSHLIPHKAKESHRYKLSKSVLDQGKIKSDRLHVRKPDTDPERADKNLLPRVIKRNNDISDTLRSIKNSDHKQYKLLKKFINNESKSISVKGQSTTPMKMGFQSKVHVKLHNIF